MTTATVTITKMYSDKMVSADDQLAVEEPLQIQMLYGPSGKEQTKNIAITMRTPGNDKELAAGFLFTEAIVHDRKQVIDVIHESSGPNTVLVILRGSYTPPIDSADRNFYISSSCGVCGKTSIDALKKTSPFIETGKPISHEVEDNTMTVEVRTSLKTAGKLMSVKAENLYALPAALKNEQLLFHTTGGLHACAVFDEDFQLVLLKEDVGRHNALDKLIGSLFLNNQLPADNMILLLSGRASFELVQKAAMAGIRFIAAIGAPSSLAVELAVECGITLIGFLKEDRFNIYSYPERIDQFFRS